jgi:hypothetical protein
MAHIIVNGGDSQGQIIMASQNVADIIVGQPDDAGRIVDTVYTRSDNLYAIYRTQERVLIEYSDVPEKEQAQRTAMAPLSPLRGEINGLIDGWRYSDSPTLQAKAKRYDRRVADSLLVALETDTEAAKSLLEQIKTDLLEDRKSTARVLYLLIAGGTTLGLILFVSVITAGWFGTRMSEAPRLLWTAGAAGGLGAFFSIAQKMRSRAILTDLQMRDNAADAVLRILIGAIGAAVLLALMYSGLFKVSINSAVLGGEALCTGAACDAAEYSIKVMLIGFIAGFLERLVPDLLEKVAAAEENTPAPVPAPKPAPEGAAHARPAEPAKEEPAPAAPVKAVASAPADKPAEPVETPKPANSDRLSPAKSGT